MKDTILKSLAVLGLLGAIVVIAWSSIKLVRMLPEAFSSLASLAESVSLSSLSRNDEPDTVLITSNTTLANAGEPVTISWGAPSTAGSFIFTYQCTEGVAIDLQGIDNLKSIACDTAYNIGDVTALTFSVDSEKKRYADVWYSLGFIGTNDTTVRASTTAQLTIINSAIESSFATSTPDETVVATTTPEVIPTIPEVTPTVPEVPREPVVVTPPAVTPVPPTKEPEVTYTIPVSNPNGRTDLSARYLGVGVIVNNKFVQKAVQQDQAGALQFEIKNYGTKTSGKWTYTVTFPDKTTYTSDAQVPLKPNERAVLTIGFAATSVRSHTFVVRVHEATDSAPLNDAFQQKVTFVK